MNESIIRAQYHRLEAECRKLRGELAQAEANRTLAETNLAEALHALELIADESSNSVGIARAARQAIEDRVAAHHRRRVAD
jgi:hypothetical protein